uniref:Rap-GAP domain-containing protein n=1 Tax=Macrostomum lignano TaxID=282301 RepID=A0A1I8F4Y7_9PLAT
SCCARSTSVTNIVTIVFQEPGALAFSPRTVRSQFQHVFIVVRAHNPCTKKLYYSVAVARLRGDAGVWAAVLSRAPVVRQGAKRSESSSCQDHQRGERRVQAKLLYPANWPIPRVLLSIPDRLRCLRASAGRVACITVLGGRAPHCASYNRNGELLRIARPAVNRKLAPASWRPPPPAWLGEQETPGRLPGHRVTVHRVTAYEASLELRGVQARRFLQLCAVPICAMPRVRAYSTCCRPRPSWHSCCATNFKSAVRCSQEMRDIFLTNRAHASVLPSRGCRQRDRQPGSRPGPWRLSLPGCVSAAPAEKPAFPDQLRRAKTRSHWSASANQFAAAAASTTSSSSGPRDSAEAAATVRPLPAARGAAPRQRGGALFLKPPLFCLGGGPLPQQRQQQGLLIIRPLLIAQSGSAFGFGASTAAPEAERPSAGLHRATASTRSSRQDELRDWALHRCDLTDVAHRQPMVAGCTALLCKASCARDIWHTI